MGPPGKQRRNLSNLQCLQNKKIKKNMELRKNTAADISANLSLGATSAPDS